MYRSILAILSGLFLLASTNSQAAAQTYKNCSTGPLSPAGFSGTTVGPFRVVVLFDEAGYMVNFAGTYGTRNRRTINQTFRAVRVNAVDLSGRHFFSLGGSGETPAGRLDFLLSLTDEGKDGFVHLDNVSKSTWQGKVLCR
jgi:hypothetical protein